MMEFFLIVNCRFACLFLHCHARCFVRKTGSFSPQTWQVTPLGNRIATMNARHTSGSAK